MNGLTAENHHSIFINKVAGLEPMAAALVVTLRNGDETGRP
jgi:hypothetical protein